MLRCRSAARWLAVVLALCLLGCNEGPEGDVVTYAGGPDACGTGAATPPPSCLEWDSGAALAASQDGAVFVQSRDVLIRIGPSVDASLLSGLLAPATDPRCRRATGDTLATRDGVVLYYVGVATICRINALNGTVALVAGTGASGSTGDGGSARRATFVAPSGLAVGTGGNLYVLDAGAARVRRISIDGVITTIAGTGERNTSGDGGPATAAEIAPPAGGGITVDAAGTVYFADACRVRAIDVGGTIRTVVGNGTCAYTGDGGPAGQAAILQPTLLAMDRTGVLYFAQQGVIVRRMGVDGVVTRVAGDGPVGSEGDDGDALDAHFDIAALTAAADGSLLIANRTEPTPGALSSDSIRRVVGPIP